MQDVKNFCSYTDHTRSANVLTNGSGIGAEEALGKIYYNGLGVGA